MPLHPAETRMNIGGQHRPRQIAKVLDAVDIGQGGGDQIACQRIGPNNFLFVYHPFGRSPQAKPYLYI